MKLSFDESYFLKQFENLLAIDSTTGYFRPIHEYVKGEIAGMGFPVEEYHKGGLVSCLGGTGNAIAIAAHLDDIGLMVRKINDDGTLNVCKVGGLYEFYCVTENVHVYTRDGQVYTGTICRTPNSIHVTEEELRKTMGDFRKNVCIVLDKPVHSAEETRKLGIETGDMVALDPRFAMSGGYLKSRFIDDKACVAILLCFMKAIKESGASLPRKVYANFTAYEEIGHGGCVLPSDVKDMIAMDIAPTGPDQNSDEHKVSIFAKDANFPYHWELTNEIRRAAIQNNINYCVDVFTPHYATDADRALWAGYDIRHAAIGPGTSNSHGYERTHLDGIRNTFNLLSAYLLPEIQKVL